MKIQAYVRALVMVIALMAMVLLVPLVGADEGRCLECAGYQYEEPAACNELLTTAGCEDGLEPYAIEPGASTGGLGRLVFLVCRNPDCPEEENCQCGEEFVPEPSSLVLFLSGLAGMATYGLRKLRK